MDTRLLQSEKKSLISFLALYTLFSLTIMFFIALLYFNFQKDLMLQKKRELLQNYAKEFIFKLKKLHRNFSKTHIYPTDKNIQTAIYDSDKVKIFSLLHQKPNLNRVLYEKNGYIHFIKEPEEYYLGAKYVVFEIKDDGIWKEKFFKKVFLYGIPFLAIAVLIGYFLLRLFLRPMRDTVLLLDRFIKDTTHELNTPVSTILTNIEMIDKNKLDFKLQKKLERIEIAARTISNIYQDLTYLVLNHKLQKRDEVINISEVIKDRCEYFKTLIKSKKIECIMDIEEDITLFIDKNRFVKLIDNLISNAIKYNKIGGKIEIIVKKGKIVVRDSGIGIKKEKLNEIFDRYKRFNSSQGGFGIGLNIVWMIAKEYDLDIKVDSKEGRYTEVKLKWQE